MHARRTVCTRYLMSAVICCGGIGAPLRSAASQTPLDTTIKKDVLADGIYLFRAPSDLDLWTATNTVVVISDQDVTVFDASTRPRTAQMIIAEIRKLTDKPVRTLINSHWHMDHWSGNAEYVKAYPGIRIIATTETRDYMQRMGQRFFETEARQSTQGVTAALDSALRKGKNRDGSPMTAESRRRAEQDLEKYRNFVREVAAVPRILPNLVYRDTLIFWSGAREFRLISETGDASAATVLYLPKEKILVTGDVLVSQEDGQGPPPWTTNSYKISPWLASLRTLSTLDLNVIVPGQGPAMRDKTYLMLTIDLFASTLAQVHSALESGKVTLAEVTSAVNLDSLGARYTPGVAKPTWDDWPLWKKYFLEKVYQESLDGARVDK
jgi:glyoxylase-like metal-dependent hydrolase (beta-lactamase superfamily II)